MTAAQEAAATADRPTPAPARTPGPAPAPPSRTWTITTTTGFTTSGYLPEWAEEDPSQTGIPLDRLPAALDDICHRAPFDGLLLRLAAGGYGPGEKRPVLAGSIDCRPDADEGQPAEPVANIHVIEDFWLTGLDPAGLAELAAALRGHADRLDTEIRPRLLAYRKDWAAHHPA